MTPQIAEFLLNNAKNMTTERKMRFGFISTWDDMLCVRIISAGKHLSKYTNFVNDCSSSRESIYISNQV